MTTPGQNLRETVAKVAGVAKAVTDAARQAREAVAAQTAPVTGTPEVSGNEGGNPQ